MNNLVSARSSILCCASKDQLMHVVYSVCEESRFNFDDRMSLKDNAERAMLQSKHGVAELLMLADKRRL